MFGGILKLSNMTCITLNSIAGLIADVKIEFQVIQI